MNKILTLASGLVLIIISISLVKDISVAYWAVILLGIAMVIGSLIEKRINWFQ